MNSLGLIPLIIFGLIFIIQMLVPIVLVIGVIVKFIERKEEKRRRKKTGISIKIIKTRE